MLTYMQYVLDVDDLFLRYMYRKNDSHLHVLLTKVSEGSDKRMQTKSETKSSSQTSQTGQCKSESHVLENLTAQ